MKPAYTIIIIGTGQHHEGHSTGNPERDADHQLKALVGRLQGTGQNITAAAFIVDGKPEMIIGNAADLPAAAERKGGNGDTGPVSGVTLEAIREEVAGMMEVVTLDGQPVTVLRGLPSVFEQLDRIEAKLSEKKTAARAPKEAKPQPEKKKEPESEQLPEGLANRQAAEEGAGAKVDDKKAAEGGDAADGQSGHEQEANGTAETTDPTEEGEG